MWNTITYSEEHQRLAILEIVLRLVVGIAQQFYDILVERIVETLTGAYGKPCVATLHLPLQTYRPGLFPEGFALGSVLHLKEYAML